MPAEIPRRRVLDVPRFAQPDDVSCGPACLAQVLAWHGQLHDIPALTARLTRNPDGGTFAVHLAALALAMGFKARLHPFGVRVFDPTWWGEPRGALVAHLRRRHALLAAEGAPDDELDVLVAWAEVLRAGATVAFHQPSPRLMAEIVAKGRPLIVGLNATWLYREARTRPHDNVHDPHAGWPTGHFVVVSGYTGRGRHLQVVDPSSDLPADLGPEDGAPGRYMVPGDRLVHAVLLGDLTRDAVLLELWPAGAAP